MKKAELIFSAILIPIDWTFLMLAGLFAYALRFHPAVVEIRPIIFELPIRGYVELITYVSVFWILIFALQGLYQIRARRGIVAEIISVTLACSTGLLFVILYIFWSREFFSSRFIVISAFIAAIIFVSVGRIIVRLIQRRLYARGIGLHSVLLIGDSSIGERIADEFSTNVALGFKVVKHIPEPTESIIYDIEKLAEQMVVDDILYIDNQKLSPENVTALVNWANLNAIAFHFSSDYLQLPRAGVDIVSVAGIPIMEFKKTTIDGWGRILKRLFDIVVSFCCIIIAALPMFVISILIKLSSKGPVLFSRLDDGKPVMRVGQYGVPFRYFKFRSMQHNTNSMRYSDTLEEQNVRKGTPLVKIKDDPRITTTGKWLRRFSLDELPELFLVLIGKMSLVGPRPHLPEEVAKYEKHQRMALTIKPGITGLSQISGRSDLTFEDEIKNDIYYIQNWSMRLDIQILIKTIPAVLRRREAI